MVYSKRYANNHVANFDRIFKHYFIYPFIEGVDGLSYRYFLVYIYGFVYSIFLLTKNTLLRYILWFFSLRVALSRSLLGFIKRPSVIDKQYFYKVRCRRLSFFSNFYFLRSSFFSPVSDFFHYYTEKIFFSLFISPMQMISILKLDNHRCEHGILCA